jgi:ABC-2 type transport system ATP-binding protein
MMIKLTHVTKLYKTVIGVNDMTLELPPGAYGLLGPNGSGKSTLLNLLTGQLRPTIGRVRVFGESPRNNAELFRRLGYCPGSEGLYANVSGYEWVRYLTQLQGTGSGTAAKAALEALVTVGMKDAMHRPIATYSRGMRQRVKLAQAIAHNPDFLILDEPFNGLDPIGRHEMGMLLKQWISEGKSLLLASHLLYEVESITDSFLLISGGRLLASGTAAEVHALLVDVPNEITIRTNDPRRLGSLLLEREITESLRIEHDHLVLSTRHPGKLYEQLPAWLEETEISVGEMHSADESLQALFNSLLKIHRGELA